MSSVPLVELWKLAFRGIICINFCHEGCSVNVKHTKYLHMPDHFTSITLNSKSLLLFSLSTVTPSLANYKGEFSVSSKANTTLTDKVDKIVHSSDQPVNFPVISFMFRWSSPHKYISL